MESDSSCIVLNSRGATHHRLFKMTSEKTETLAGGTGNQCTSQTLSISSVPPGWHSLNKDDRDSTVSYFCGGYRRPSDGTEVQVWHGTRHLYAERDDGTVVTGDGLDELSQSNQDIEIEEGVNIDGFEEQGPADDYKYVVERHLQEDSVESELTQSLNHAASLVESWLSGSGSNPGE